MAILLLAIYAVIAHWMHGLFAVGIIGIISFSALMSFSSMVGFEAAVETTALGFAAFALFKIIDAAAGIIFDWRTGLGWKAILKARPPKGSK